MKGWIKYLLFTVLFTACQRDEEDYDYGTIIFYKQTTSGSFSVFVNQRYWGEVPYVDRTPACNTTEGLRLKFAPGTHIVDVRNNNSTVYVPPVQVALSKGECKLYRVPQ